MKLQNADEETKKLVREVMDAHVDDGLKTLDSQLGKYFLEEVRKVMTSSEFDNKGFPVTEARSTPCRSVKPIHAIRQSLL